MVYTNKYLKKDVNGVVRTSRELTDYYQNKNYYNKNGYTSKYYGLTYYDGYGYNYYSGSYGYYEYSRPPIESTGPPWDVGKFLIIFAVSIAVLIFFIGLYLYCLLEEIKADKEKAERENKRLKFSSSTKSGSNLGEALQPSPDKID